MNHEFEFLALNNFECTKLISAEQVITTIEKIPTFKGNEEK